MIIVGLGQLGEALLVRLLKDWLIEPPVNASLRVTVIDVAADERRRHFAQRFPGLAGDTSVEFLALDIHDSQLVRAGCFGGGDAEQAHPSPSPQAVFICLDNDSQALYAALTLRGLVAAGTPIIVRMSEESGLATVLGITAASDGLPDVTAVGLLDTACSLELVQGGTREILAQAIHQGYVMDQLAAGQSPQRNPALAPWHRLPDDLKQSNREQADHIRSKLKLIGCELAAQPGYPVELLEFTADEVERLAQIEHDRWTAERRAAGWKHGPKKDIERKISPHLVAWRQLAEDAKDYNRDAVRRIPKVLAKADFAIRRVEPPEAIAIADARPMILTPRRRSEKQAA